MSAQHPDPAARLKLEARDPLLQQFAALLFEKANPEFLDTFDSDSLLTIARDAFSFFRQPSGDIPRVNVFNPDPEKDGWESPYTVVRIDLTDRPFIVDSVTAEIKRQDFELYYMLHPVFGVRRGQAGELDQLGRPGSDAALANEAFELFFIELETDPERLQKLEDGITSVLTDVVRATDAYGALSARAVEVAASLREDAARLPDQAEELTENADFLDWLADDNFVFLGYREYDITEAGGDEYLAITKGSGLGILTDVSRSAYAEPVRISEIKPGLRSRVTGGNPLVVTKTNAESTVHRPVRMDYIGVKKLAADGSYSGERRFLGLFTTKALSTPVNLIPILRRKLRQVLELDGASRGSHDYKQIVSIFDSLPREELFWNDAAQLQADIRTIMTMDEDRTVRLSVRADPMERGVGIIVIMPRDRFSANVRRRVQRFLTSALKANHVDYRLTMGEDEGQARLHFFFTTDLVAADVDARALEKHVTDLSRSWSEDLQARLVEKYGRIEGRHLARRYTDAFDERFIADSTALKALSDTTELEELDEGRFRVRLLDASSGRHAGAGMLRIYHEGRGLILSEALPLLENVGLRVLEQTSYQVRIGTRELVIESFQVRPQHGGSLPTHDAANRLTAGLEELLQGEAEDDRLNALLLSTTLNLRQVSLLRAYAMYYAQVSAATSRSFLESSLVAHPAAAEAIWNYFAVRFDPATGESLEARSARLEQLGEEFLAILTNVTLLSEDTALRGIFNLVESTVRTSFYLNLPRISIKLDSHMVSQMPDPRPLYEIAVSAPGVDGTHLRGGMVARGGIRWSDRADDFRSEVLGLMKTQMTKNAVIVPVGSKGGFVVKREPQDRGELREYVKQQYQTYIRGLLDLTDNVVDGQTVQPAGLVIWDEPDTYMVVAADKGTATFSDVANATAAEYGYWLGDAFASGGSHGYDHKAQGITANGAWQTVSRHFRELGIDVKNDEFTAAGIGDMAGDVFGNGMLYTDKLRLQAAFNHLHIFLDPEPDAARGHVERRRLFTTPGSSWTDYDRSLISEGGGIFERAAKSIPLSPQVRAMLDVEAEELSGQELIRAILRMPVDLLWNGGIGTYVKASTESHADVRDAGNDSVRVDGNELRARVVGEGGNLGFTQQGRIEYARGGGNINTDAIDNSGGVDLSDHEVNIKILLQAAMADGKLTLEDRNVLLEQMTPDVVNLVLKNNYSQSLALSMAVPRSAQDLQLFSTLQEYLSERGDLDPRVEYLPTARQLQELQRAGQGYSRPELAVLLAYVKMGLYRRLLETDLTDEPHFEHYLLEYFPDVLVERFPEATRNHSLRREITATQFTNRVVDLLGISFVHRLLRDTGATPVEVIRASLISLEIMQAGSFVQQVFALDNKVPADVQHSLLGELVGAVDGLVQWMILSDLGKVPVAEFVSTYQEPLQHLQGTLPDLLQGSPAERFRANAAAFEAMGVPAGLARMAATYDFLPASVGAIEVSRAAGLELTDAATRFYNLGERLSLGWLRDLLNDMDKPGKWEKIGTGGLIMDLRSSQRELTLAAVRAGATDMTAFLERFGPELARYDDAIREIRADGLDFASGSVIVRFVETLQNEAMRGS